MDAPIGQTNRRPKMSELLKNKALLILSSSDILGLLIVIGI